MKVNKSVIYLLAIIAGFVSALYFSMLSGVAFLISETFIRLLKLMGLPLIFFSVISVICNIEELSIMKMLGKRVVIYTFFTTVLASCIGLLFFKIAISNNFPSMTTSCIFDTGYLLNAVSIIPDNIVNVFGQKNIFGVLIIAIAMGLSIFYLNDGNKRLLAKFFEAMFAAVINIVNFITKLVPIAIWAFTFILTNDLEEKLIGKDIGNEGISIKMLLTYSLCILISQIFHGCIVLPILLKIKKISPMKTLRGSLQAIALAFFSKSSSATLPVVMKNARDNLKLSKNVTEFIFPLCSTINMNGCAIFIIITVLFMSALHGAIYSYIDMALWVIISSVAAICNAGVPMGSYFLVVAILSMVDIPFSLSGIILTLNATIFDMFETSLNVWSDICIASIVNKDINKITTKS